MCAVGDGFEHLLCFIPSHTFSIPLSVLTDSREYSVKLNTRFVSQLCAVETVNAYFLKACILI